MRLQKFLSAAGVCSRRKGEELIKKGVVSVNGRIVTELGTKVDPEKDRVEVDGKTARLTGKSIYIALNKPPGYVTSCSHKGEKIILDLVDAGERIFPVGRLDKDSVGLLLLTNDGRIHHRLSHPSFDHEKEYDVKTVRALSDSDLKKMAGGIVIDGRKTRRAKVWRKGPDRFRIVLKEGRNRQIRKMVASLGNEVRVLKRVRFAGIEIGRLKQGGWRYLSDKEVGKLLEGV